MKKQIKKAIEIAKKNPIKTGLGVAAAVFAGKKIYDKVKENKNEDN